MASKVQYGSIALLLSGLLTFVGLVLRGPTVNPVVDAAGYIQGAAAYTQAGFLLTTASVLQIVGAVVLYWYLSDGGSKSRVTWALVLTIVGIGLFLPFAGGTFIPNATIGQLYDSGNTQVIQVAEATYSSPLALYLLFTSLFPYVAGHIILGHLLWKQGGLMKVVGSALAVHAPLVTIVASASYIGEIVGGLLLFIAGTVFAWKVFSDSSGTVT